MWFLAGVCVFICARLSTFQTTIAELEISSWYLVEPWIDYAPSIVTIFIQIDDQSEIWRKFEFFEKYLW